MPTALKRVQFWGVDAHDDSLVREILRGEKTATVCKASEYRLPDGEFDTGDWEVGDLVEVYDLQGTLRCLIRVTEVYNVRFGAIPEKLWRGEVCRDAEHFRDAHRFSWPDEDLTADFEMTATHFALVAPVDEEPPQGPDTAALTHTSSPFGDLSLLWCPTPTGPQVQRPLLKRILLSRPGSPGPELAHALYPTAPVARDPAMDALAEQLQRLLEGEPLTFDLDAIALDACPAFQRRVLLAEYAIPRGSVSSYGRIAAHLGVPGGARAVGNALATNPFPLIIPCHRAVRGDGTLGGYQGGLAMKRALLTYEGHTFSPTGQLIDPRLHY